MDVLYIIIFTLFTNKRTPFFSPCRIFCFLLCCFYECVFKKGLHKSVVVEVRHVWLKHEIYQHNNVAILNIKYQLMIAVIVCTYHMVFRCCVVNCRSNYAGEEKTTVFSFPEEEHLRKTWIKFVKRKDWEPTNSSYIYIKHFEDNYYQKGEGNKSFRLMKTLKPVPTQYLIQLIQTSGILQPVR